MVEVFKTNVRDADTAARVLFLLQLSHPQYLANFDLEDCDNILRIETPDHALDALNIIRVLAEAGFQAAILPDLVETRLERHMLE